MSQLDVILFTHFHVDHSADFPALIFSSWFEERERPLPVYGPAGDSEFPSTVDFVHAFFNSRNGIYRYLSFLLPPQKERSCGLTMWSGIHPRRRFVANIFRRMPHGSFMGLSRP
jgi:phosphoribosyl 1,2-cyclic phosphodiesterase